MMMMMMYDLTLSGSSKTRSVTVGEVPICSN